MTTSGRRCGPPVSETTARPAVESARMNVWGSAQRPRTSRRLVRTPGPLRSDNLDAEGKSPPGLSPVEQQPRDRLVELLVRGFRPASAGSGLCSLQPSTGRWPRRSRRVPPAAPGDEQAALGLRMQPTHPFQQLASRAGREPLSGENERDVLAGGWRSPRARPAPRTRRLPCGRCSAVRTDPPARARLRRARWIVVDEEQDGIGHAPGLYRRRRDGLEPLGSVTR